MFAKLLKEAGEHEERGNKLLSVLPEDPKVDPTYEEWCRDAQPLKERLQQTALERSNAAQMPEGAVGMVGVGVVSLVAMTLHLSITSHSALPPPVPSYTLFDLVQAEPDIHN